MWSLICGVTSRTTLAASMLPIPHPQCTSTKSDPLLNVKVSLISSSVPAQINNIFTSGTAYNALKNLPNNAAGFAQAFVALRNAYAPNVLLAYHISTWYSLHLSWFFCLLPPACLLLLPFMHRFLLLLRASCFLLPPSLLSSCFLFFALF